MTMNIEEATVEVRLVLPGGAVLSLCQSTVKVTEVVRVRGKLDLISEDHQKQRVEVIQNVNLQEAKFPDIVKPEKVETAEKETQSDPEEPPPPTPAPDFPVPDILEPKIKPELVDATIQTEEIKMEATEENYLNSRHALIDGEAQTDFPLDNVERPVVAELLEQLGQLEAARASEQFSNLSPKPECTEEDSPKEGTADEEVTVHRNRKRRVIRQVPSSDEEDNVAKDLSDSYESENDGMEEMAEQWSKDLQRVIRSLEQDEEHRTIKNSPTAIHKSKRKRGRPRKISKPAKVTTKTRERKEKKEKEEKEEDDKDGEEKPGKAKKKKRFFHCFGCDEIFPKKTLLKEHKKTCTAAVPASVNEGGVKVFKCDQCEKEYKKLTHLKRHQLVHKQIRNHVCQVCAKAFYRKEHLVKHETTHQVFKCQYCQQVITGKAHFMRHERQHMPDAPPLRPPAKKNTPCRFCGKMFAGKAQCEQHEITHTNERPWKCSYCEVRFSKRGNALKHERRIHLRLKPFMCMFCGKTFAQKPDCKKHEMRHLGEKRVKCNYCDKMFLENHHRIVHERTHTGERPYKCVICNHAFAQSYDCKKHMRIHLKENGTTRHHHQKHQPTSSLQNEEARAVEYLQMQVQRKTHEQTNNIQQHPSLIQQPPPQPQQPVMEAHTSHAHPHTSHSHQMYPMYDYQTISTSALNPEYMMQAVASNALHQMAPPAPTPVFAPHHDMQQGMFPPNTFDIRKMQEIMGAQNNPDSSKLIP